MLTSLLLSCLIIPCSSFIPFIVKVEPVALSEPSGLAPIVACVKPPALRVSILVVIAAFIAAEFVSFYKSSQPFSPPNQRPDSIDVICLSDNHCSKFIFLISVISTFSALNEL